jgi:general secretion pathway protein A
MYLDYYGLKEKPFTLSPDPKYLYYSDSHKEALARMIYAITQNNGIMLLTGEVGTGKTSLINATLESLPKTYQVVNVRYTIVSPMGLLQNICRELSIAYSNRNMAELVGKLQEYLKWKYQLGKKSVLILDEAQNLYWDTLELIRLLSNVESKNEKYFQILFIGQPELDAKLSTPKLRHLRERIGLRFHLRKLTRKETEEYVNHRISVAGSDGRAIFQSEAFDTIYNCTEGIPRRINILCDNALLMGYSRNQDQIGPDIIEESRDEVKMGQNGFTYLNENGGFDSPTEDSPTQQSSGPMGRSREGGYTATKVATSTKTIKINKEQLADLVEEIIDDKELMFFKKQDLKKLTPVTILIFIGMILAFVIALAIGSWIGIIN